MTANDSLDDMCRGIRRELYKLKEVLTLSEYIGGEAKTLTSEGFAQFFGALQQILGRALLLHAARLFDRQRTSKQRSLPWAVEQMRNDSVTLSIPGRDMMIDALVKLGVKECDVEHLNDPALTQYVADFFQAKLLAAGINKTRERLKKLRDRVLAHHDIVDATHIPTPVYEEIYGVVDLADRFLDVVLIGYRRVDNNANDDVPRRSTICLRRLLERAGIQTTLPEPTFT